MVNFSWPKRGPYKRAPLYNKTNQITDLPAEDSEGPDVWLGGESGVVEHLWRRPLDGELGAAVGSVLVVDDVAGQTEVSHLQSFHKYE